MLPPGAEAAKAFSRVVDRTYERRSLIITSNVHASGFDTIKPRLKEIVAGLAPVLPGLSGRLADRLTAEPGQPLLEDGPIYVRLERPK